MMAPAEVVFYFLVGLALGAFFVTVADRVYEGGWRGGPTIVALSLPVTIAYFVALWAVAVWRSWPRRASYAEFSRSSSVSSRSTTCALSLQRLWLFFKSPC